VKPAICAFLAIALGGLPLVAARAQGFGAIQAVRQRAEGIGQGPPGEPPPPGAFPPGPGPGPEGGPGYGVGAAAGAVDTTYVPANASMLVVIRPAQFFASPALQALPLDVLTMTARQQLGVDPGDVEEVIVFGDLMTQSGGMVVKFNKPFRASSIPQPLLTGVKLSEFNGKKYLQGMGPKAPSFYGPNNKTLLVAPDEILKQMVQSAAAPKTGPFFDRVNTAALGSDLYALVDLASFKPMLQLFAGGLMAKVPADKKALAEALLEGIAGAEINAHLTAKGPISVVLRFTDEAAAQKAEMAFAAANQAEGATAVEAPPGIEQASANPFSLIKSQFKERLKQKNQPQRNGAEITWFHIDAEDPLQPQLLPMLIGAAMRDEPVPDLKSLELGFAMPGMMPGGPPNGPPGVGLPPGSLPPGAPGVGPEGQPIPQN